MNELGIKILQLLFRIDIDAIQKEINTVKGKNDILQRQLLSQQTLINELNESVTARDVVLRSYEITLDPLQIENFKLNFDITNDISGESGMDDKWGVVTSYCQLGGCEQSEFVYDNCITATQKAVLLTLQGKEAVTGSACQECYQEYLQSNL